MKMLRAAFFAATIATLATQIPAAAAPPAPAPSTSCENLAALALPHATVTSAEPVAAGAFVAPSGRGAGGATGAARGLPGRGGGPPTNPYANVPAFCRVSATLTPSPDSDIKAEVWLPASGWNGKFQAVGNGGWAGSICYPAMAAAVAAGYATASTDTGHTGGTADFALGHPEKLIDFGYRAIHEMTAFAKPVVDAFYGSAPKTLVLQRLLDRRTPGAHRSAALSRRLRRHRRRRVRVGRHAHARGPRRRSARWLNAQSRRRDSAGQVPDDSRRRARRVRRARRREGRRDREPAAVPLRLREARVQGRRRPGLPDAGTSGIGESADVADQRSKTGKVIDERHLWPGAELGWATLGGAEPLRLSPSGLANIVFKDPNWDWRTFESPGTTSGRRKRTAARSFSGDPNLKPFFDHGGKLLMYHGWTDQQVTPQLSTIYYDNVVKTRRQGRRGERHRAVHGARHEPLPRRRGHGHVRQDGGDRSSGSRPAARRRRSSHRT